MRPRRGLSPQSIMLLATVAYFVAIPFLRGAGNGYFTIVSLLPVIASGLVHGLIPALRWAAAFTGINFAAVILFEGSADSMTAPGGLLGTVSLFAVAGLLGYLSDLSQRRLDQIVEEKDRLIGTISHELRTPLSTVLGLSHELSDRLDDFSSSDVREFAQMIAQQSVELEALIEDLLVAARADIERITVQRLSVPVAEPVEHALLSLPNTADREIILDLDGSVLALADPLRIRQIVRNLVHNALRYGGPKITIGVRSSREGCIIAVADNGVGIDPDLADTIFQPHVRAHDLDGLTDSLGLGLYVSQTLAGMMDGTLRYRRRDSLTQFELVLPAAEEPSALSA